MQISLCKAGPGLLQYYCFSSSFILSHFFLLFFLGIYIYLEQFFLLSFLFFDSFLLFPQQPAQCELKRLLWWASGTPPRACQADCTALRIWNSAKGSVSSSLAG